MQKKKIDEIIAHVVEHRHYCIKTCKFLKFLSEISQPALHRESSPSAITAFKLREFTLQVPSVTPMPATCSHTRPVVRCEACSQPQYAAASLSPALSSAPHANKMHTQHNRVNGRHISLQSNAAICLGCISMLEYWP